MLADVGEDGEGEGGHGGVGVGDGEEADDDLKKVKIDLTPIFKSSTKSGHNF